MYLLFCFDVYYPCGGWDDYKGSFSSIEEAKKKAKELNQDDYQIVSGTHIVEEGHTKNIELKNREEENLNDNYTNFYKCSECGHTWSDEWPHVCNDNCPSCGIEIEPWLSEDSNE